MKTIGLLGGMGPASTLLYYDTLCALTRERLGGNASPPVILHAFDFAQMQAHQQAGEWDLIGRKLSAAGRALVAAGADVILLATNTMHKVAHQFEDTLGAPFLHIADVTAAQLNADGRTRPALIGTRYTMEETFYTDRLSRTLGRDILTPDMSARAMLQAAIFDELVKGTVTPQTTANFMTLASQLQSAGADSLILGCTEIGLVLTEANCPLPVYDTARLHCVAAISFAL